MKKRIKKLSAIVAILTILCIVGSFSAFALIDYTENWYMNGSLMFGYSRLDDNSVSSSTYCGNRNYEKRVKMIYRFYYSDGSEGPDEIDSTYKDDGAWTVSVSLTGGSVGKEIYEVTGIHWVRAATHMYWCSSDCEDNSYVYRDFY